jgi:hypothetical protein
LQFGAEAASALFGGLLAALQTPLPLIVYSVLLIIEALILLPYELGLLDRLHRTRQQQWQAK